MESSHLTDCFLFLLFWKKRRLSKETFRFSLEKEKARKRNRPWFTNGVGAKNEMTLSRGVPCKLL